MGRRRSRFERRPLHGEGGEQIHQEVDRHLRQRDLQRLPRCRLADQHLVRGAAWRSAQACRNDQQPQHLQEGARGPGGLDVQSATPEGLNKRSEVYSLLFVVI